MEKNKTLLILAAGMGSRFGGLKQIEPIGPNGEIIIDYSIYDAINAGFNKVVFVIKEENYEYFKNNISSKFDDKIECVYAFQKIDNLPLGFSVPEGRVKPFGTGQAMISAIDDINEAFAVINADDFYGRDAFVAASNYLDVINPNEFSMIAYNVENTLTEYGSVKRGVCEEKNGYLTKLIESIVERSEDGIIATPLFGGDSFKVEEGTPVSMSFFCLTPEILEYTRDNFGPFLEKNRDKLSTIEYLLPEIVFEMISKDLASVKVIQTNAVWHGVTYPEDKKEVVESVNNLVKKKVYPSKLWK